MDPAAGQPELDLPHQPAEERLGGGGRQIGVLKERRRRETHPRLGKVQSLVAAIASLPASVEEHARGRLSRQALILVQFWGAAWRPRRLLPVLTALAQAATGPCSRLRPRSW